MVGAKGGTRRLGCGDRIGGDIVSYIEASAILSNVAYFAHRLNYIDTSVHTYTKVFLILKMGGDEPPYERIVP